MGNCFSLNNTDSAHYKRLVNSQNNESMTRLENEIYIQRRQISHLELKLSELENTYHNHFQQLFNSTTNNTTQIQIMTKDLESLLNNDKILLDKLIEKNIVSTIETNNNNGNNNATFLDEITIN